MTFFFLADNLNLQSESSVDEEFITPYLLDCLSEWILYPIR